MAQALESARASYAEPDGLQGAAAALAAAIERKDRYTGGHCKRVAYHAARIARAMGMGAEAVERMRLAALLHDVGKVGIEDRILQKASPLDAGEWKAMQTHPEIGHGLLAALREREIVDGMRHHHERWDGQGYPAGLAGRLIPLSARIIAVADTYDAMVSTRPYRKGLDSGFAREELLRHSGTQFDPEVVAAFVKTLLP